MGSEGGNNKAHKETDKEGECDKLHVVIGDEARKVTLRNLPFES